jgi:hypothetical protein
MIRRNAEEAQSYAHDLLKWQQEAAQADLRHRQAASSAEGSPAASQPPVRCCPRRPKWSVLLHMHRACLL